MADKMITESGLTFSFDAVNDIVKFDDTPFYRGIFQQLPGSKGVDIIAASSNLIQLIEIKNCIGHEAENRWRLSTDNKKLKSAPFELDVNHRDSLDIEVAKKVAMTIACVYGVWTKQQYMANKAAELKFVWEALFSRAVMKDQKQILVVLFLEGDFGTPTRSKKVIMKRLQDSIKKKLKWMNCQVSVVDSSTYRHALFTVT